MRNKNILVILVSLFFTVNVNAQTGTYSSRITSSKRVNAFTWGNHPVNTISDNFENLFRNVPQMISNPDSIQFLRYEYVATLQNKEDAINYFLKNLHENASIVYYYSKGSKVYISTSTLHNFQRDSSIDLFKKWIDKKNIQKGDQVYRIDFVVNHKNMQHYVFVDPKTKQVVITKDSYFGHIIQDIKLKYSVVLDTIISQNIPAMSWFQPRAGVVPGKPSTIVITLQEFMTGHSDVYQPLVSMYSQNNGKTWSSPGDKGNAFFYRKMANGVYTGQCDFTPKWNKYARVLLATGHTVHYRNERLAGGFGRSTVYSTYDPKKKEWTKWRALDKPDDSMFYNSGAGAAQRVDLRNGDILLPVYFKSKEAGRYAVTVFKCSFDGKNLTYKAHGNILTVNVGRGLVEPSLTCFKGKYYLTIRNDKTGYYAVSKDGLHFSTPKVWYFDNGREVGTYNTQQHWVTHSSGLFLVYTRRGAHNDNVPRNRAPLFMSRVDTKKMVLIKRSERVLIPNRGAPLGNFGVSDISKNETWVTAAESMRKNRKEQMEQGADGNVLAARILWSKPNLNWDR